MSPKLILVVIALACFAGATLDFFPTRLIGAGLFFISLTQIL